VPVKTAHTSLFSKGVISIISTSSVTAATAVVMLMATALAQTVRSEPNQAIGPTVWDGIYSVAQADRGQEAYAAHCGACHGPTLMGGSAAELAGSRFHNRWAEDSLGALFTYLQSAMPQDAPGSLSERAYLEILAYILRVNDYPSGAAEMTAAVVRETRVTGKDGPEKVPNFQLVQVLGCFQPSGRDTALVSRATEPERTRDPGPAIDLAALKTRSLGTSSFTLIFIPGDPSDYAGRKVSVKGLLIRDATGGGASINVMSLQTVASACDQ